MSIGLVRARLGVASDISRQLVSGFTGAVSVQEKGTLVINGLL